MLRTIEAACGSSPSRAPETHLATLHLLQSPPVGRTAAPFLSSWPWLVPRCARCWCPKVASPGRLWCASHAGPCVRFPRSARPLHLLDNINMLPIRAGTTNRHWQRPTGNSFGTGFRLKTRRDAAKLDWNSVAASVPKLLPGTESAYSKYLRRTRLPAGFFVYGHQLTLARDHGSSSFSITTGSQHPPHSVTVTVTPLPNPP